MVKSVNPVSKPEVSTQLDIRKSLGEAAGLSVKQAKSNTEAGSVLSAKPEPRNQSPRLVIEENQGQFVYKTLDPSTGEVLSQFPREELLKAQNDATTKPGMVINTRR